VLLESGSAQEIADALERVIASPDEYAARMQAAGVWARQYSLEGLRDALARLLDERWKRPGAVPPALQPRPSAK
jgi:hypothetical protein